MEADRRTRLTPEQRRAQLVSLGVAALVDRPLEALTIEYLSEQAGVSRGLLFYYFGSKHGLHREVVRTARDSMLHATEPSQDLPPLDRLRDTLTRIVQFVRDHRETFFSLVRGAASGNAEVRAVVEQARASQAERVIAVFLELGVADSELLRIALRSWVAFAEEALVESALNTEMPSGEIALFLERTVTAIAASVEQREIG
ncbi:TetR/AcrR family transcriptional regulator [Lacisediminihabitans profunda]|uniref:TetR/AcrR family transcriptional regulator n=1 Tax=Lacisediminihabitans profunda TaxID=2594790 RepID=A0A5C8ULH8_9MICO|nr:TetR/AcrR family transcriptional regulator [Lacisediminihabitans profunda]TXN29003.1 TetR/AcrR family transcriptional regulator [Lacisediminihabitans profunda]